MKTQFAPGSFRGVLARDSLKLKPEATPKNSLFGVLYDFLLYAAIPVAFEMSYIKIFQNSMKAYEMNDVASMGRLIIYFIIQWFLGVLVRKEYIKTSLKRLTLVLMIFVQLQEAFFEEVLFDMMLSMVLESGLAILLFLKFAQLMVILQLLGLCLIIFCSIIYTRQHPVFAPFQIHVKKLTVKLGSFIHRIKCCMGMYMWHHSGYRIYLPKLA